MSTGSKATQGIRISVLEARAAAWGKAARWIPRCRSWRIWRLATVCGLSLALLWAARVLIVLLLLKFGVIESGSEWLPGWVDSLRTRVLWVGAGAETLVMVCVMAAGAGVLVALLTAGVVVSEGLKASEGVSARRAQETGDLARALREASELESVARRPARGRKQDRRL